MESDGDLERPVPLIGYVQHASDRNVDSIESLARECGFAVYSPDPWLADAVGQPQFSIIDPPEWPPDWPAARVALPRRWSIRAGQGPPMLLVTGTERVEGWHTGGETLGSKIRNWLPQRLRRHRIARVEYPDVSVMLVAIGVRRRVFRRALKSLRRID
jgi:hypothetical protein